MVLLVSAEQEAGKLIVQCTVEIWASFVYVLWHLRM